LEIDSNFTAAKASLGGLEFERFDRQRGIILLDEAIQAIDHLTEKEKYGIQAFHEANVKGNIDKAIEYTKILIELYPDNHSAYNNLGWYYRLQGKYDQAVANFKKALHINPYLLLTYSSLNWLYLNRLSNLDSAMVWINKQIKYDSTNYWGYDYLGWAYCGYDSLTKARQAFEKALSINPEFILDLYRLSNIYRIKGKYREAMEPLKKIIKINPGEISAYYTLGYLHQLLGEPDQAKSNYVKSKILIEQEIKKEPRDGGNYMDLGLVLARLGDKNEAMKMGKRAMQIDSSQHFSYAMLLSIQGKYDDAVEHLYKAREHGTLNYIWMKVDADFDDIRDHPGYKKLLAEGLHKG